MKFNQNPILRIEDFPEHKDIFNKLFIQLNPFIQLVNQILDRNIDYVDNIRAITRDYSINNFKSFGLLWTYQNFRPIDLRITRSSKGTQQTPILLLPTWSYDLSTQVISIQKILEVSETGITSLSGDLGQTYYFTIRASV